MRYRNNLGANIAPKPWRITQGNPGRTNYLPLLPSLASHAKAIFLPKLNALETVRGISTLVNWTLVSSQGPLIASLKLLITTGKVNSSFLRFSIVTQRTPLIVGNILMVHNFKERTSCMLLSCQGFESI